ncbi:MAG: hypothetical protein ACLFRA_02660 [Alphaproteobacteria bacterium]
MDLDYQIQPADEDPEIGFPKEERSVEEAGEHFPGMDNVIFDSNPQNTAPNLDIPQWDTGADPLVPDEDIPRPEAIFYDVFGGQEAPKDTSSLQQLLGEDNPLEGMSSEEILETLPEGMTAETFLEAMHKEYHADVQSKLHVQVVRADPVYSGFDRMENSTALQEELDRMQPGELPTQKHWSPEEVSIWNALIERDGIPDSYIGGDNPDTPEASDSLAQDILEGRVRMQYAEQQPSAFDPHAPTAPPAMPMDGPDTMMSRP